MGLEGLEIAKPRLNKQTLAIKKALKPKRQRKRAQDESNAPCESSQDLQIDAAEVPIEPQQVETYEGPLPGPQECQRAIDEYRLFLKDNIKLSANSINNSLTAIEHALKFMKVSIEKTARETWPQLNIRALTSYEEEGFVHAATKCKSRKDKALVLLLLDTGIKLGECAALNVDDVHLTAHTGRITVGGRTIILGADCRKALTMWLIERSKRFENEAEAALFLNLQGKRISTVSIDSAVRRVGRAALLDVSAQVLRDTCLTNLVRKGSDLTYLAYFCGHRSVESTFRRFNPLMEELGLKGAEGVQGEMATLDEESALFKVESV